MNKQELINVPRILFPIGTEILIKGKIVGLKVLDDRFVENVVKLDYGEQIIAPNDAIYVKDEPQPVKVPQFVADWIEVCKEHLTTSLYTAMTPNFMKENNQSFDFILWIKKTSNQDLFARAWLDGYEVEEEPKYIVKMKSIDTNFNSLNRHRNENYWIFSSKDENTLYQTQHTRKELEDADFGWVFDCPGIEIEEVE